MIALPQPADRSWLSAFGVALAVVAGLGALALAVWGATAVAALLALAAAALAAVAIWRAEAFAPVHDLYVRVARRVALGVRSFVLRACHATVIRGASLAGSSMALARPRPGGSLWLARRTIDPTHYASLWDGPGNARGGLRDLVRWSWSGGRAWAMGLVPFLILLRVTGTEGGRAFPTRIYTLY